MDLNADMKRKLNRNEKIFAKGKLFVLDAVAYISTFLTSDTRRQKQDRR